MTSEKPNQSETMAEHRLRLTRRLIRIERLVESLPEAVAVRLAERTTTQREGDAHEARR